jgi:Complex I intermediate-associated protein 30 (CIA30)
MKFDPEHYASELPMVSFPTAESLQSCLALGCDNDTGGYSTATVTHVLEDDVSCLRFQGNLSLALSAEAKARGVTHSGWAGWRTSPMKSTLFKRYFHQF